MLLIDDTNHAGLVSSNEQNGPPMNADKRRWNAKAVFIGVYPRSSAAK
jgi:hypothetical protein